MFGLLIAIGAGFLVPHLEKPLAKPIIAALGGFIKIEAAETRLVAFLVALVGAAVLLSVVGSGSPFGLSVGIVVGYFGTRILAAFQGKED